MIDLIFLNYIIIAMKKLPQILIIGRQNVGKSTLFNKIIRKRYAIVYNSPGITRDYNTQIVKINDYYYNLIDTGGLTDEEDLIQDKIKKQVINLCKNSDLILFLVEKQGLVPLDYEIADLIRKVNKNTILLINKTDTPVEVEKLKTIGEFYELGFKNILPISAEHKINFDKLFDEINKLIPQKISNLDKRESEIKIGIIGKPNVGKSSLINYLAKSERVLVTEKPGTTRDSIDVEVKYQNNIYTFIDTAGIRKKSKVKNTIEYFSIKRAIKTIKRADIIVYVTSVENIFSEADKKIFYHIHKNLKPCIIVVNKWDLIEIKNEKKQKQITNYIYQKAPFVNYVPITFISALTGHNVYKIFNRIQEIFINYNFHIPTAKFNKFVQNIINKNSPPQEGGFVKIYYATQIKTAPPQFVFFTNKPHKIKENYKNFLVNSLRKHFNFSGTPILIKFKKK